MSTLELKVLQEEPKSWENGRITQIGHGAPSVRCVCGTGDEGGGYTRAKGGNTSEDFLSQLINDLTFQPTTVTLYWRRG